MLECAQTLIDIDVQSHRARVRNLVFATDAWVRRAILGHSQPYSPLGLPHDEMEPDPSVPHDADARPSLDDGLRVVDGLGKPDVVGDRRHARSS